MRQAIDRSNPEFSTSWLLVLPLCAALSACGSSGGSSDDADDGNTTSNPSSASAARTSVIAPGDPDCPNGGILVETGIDENDNGLLEDPEVDSSSKVCNGANGLNALINQSAEPAGANCTLGGVRLDIGIDVNGNDILDAGEITDTTYVCNPAGLSAGAANGWEQLDDWGDAWDGAERSPKNWADADAQCQALGGRLPTMTELWRVSAAQTGTVGNTYTTSYLWSRTWWDKSLDFKGVLRLTDGAIISSGTTNLNGYRCIWPSSSGNSFAGKNCYGPPGNECWNTVGDRGAMNMDRYERPAVSYVAAHDECNFYNAHLAHLQDFAENVRAGLPNGSNEWLWAADAARYDFNFLVRWSGTDSAFTDYGSTYQAWSDRFNVNRRFRCKGVAADLGTHPDPVPDEFVAPGPKIKGSAALNTPVIFSSAIDACSALGGHMAHPRDIIELARAGMPNGPGTGGSDFIWLSDRSRYDITQVTRWGGTDDTFSDYYPEHSTWATVNNTTTYQYRCAYYPQDPAYAAPADVQCAGGNACYQASFGPGPNPVRYAMDSEDRSAVTYDAAIDDCVASGGRLPNTLQLTELIRSGLPNGTTAWLWTSDSAGNDANGFALATIFNWNGVDTVFEPIFSGNATWSVKDVTTNAYRCIWSNELW